LGTVVWVMEIWRFVLSMGGLGVGRDFVYSGKGRWPYVLVLSKVSMRCRDAGRELSREV
jgi:hypothetical protein